MIQVLEKKQNITETAEFRAAVQEAAAQEAAKAVAAAMSGMSSKSENASSDSAQDLMKILAVELSKMSGNANGQVYVDPEILYARDQSRKKMHKLMHEAEQNKTPPRYRVINKMFFGDELIVSHVLNGQLRPKERIIKWYGEPNEAMIPVNEVARKIYDEFKNSISMKSDPNPVEDVWVNENGVVMYGVDPARKRNREAPRAHPLLELEDSDSYEGGVDSPADSPFFKDGFNRDVSLTNFAV